LGFGFGGIDYWIDWFDDFHLFVGWMNGWMNEWMDG
jgi:hypothetical protein